MRVSILKLSHCLIASIQSALTDKDLLRLRDDLAEMAAKYRSRGIIVDVRALDVMDSFAVRTLKATAQILGMGGARTVIVGIQPEAAFAMFHMGLTLRDTLTALDLEEGLNLIEHGRDPSE